MSLSLPEGTAQCDVSPGGEWESSIAHGQGPKTLFWTALGAGCCLQPVVGLGCAGSAQRRQRGRKRARQALPWEEEDRKIQHAAASKQGGDIKDDMGGQQRETLGQRGSGPRECLFGEAGWKWAYNTHSDSGQERGRRRRGPELRVRDERAVASGLPSVSVLNRAHSETTLHNLKAAP